MTERDKMDERQKEVESDRKRGFEDFINNPLTRMMMSQIPPGEHPEALRMLLQAAYESGFGSGGVVAVLGLLMEVSKKGSR